MRSVKINLVIALGVLLVVTPLGFPRAESSGKVWWINGHKVEEVRPGEWLVDDTQTWVKVEKIILRDLRLPPKMSTDNPSGDGGGSK